MAGPPCAVGAPVYDPLSARIAEMVGWDICKLSASVAKSAELALPDDIDLFTMSDMVDICRRILRAADVSLTVDADDGGETALNVYRTVRELESAGAAGIEIEDNSVPRYYGQAARHAMLVPTEIFVGKCKAALDARRDDATVIIAHTSVIQELPRPEALDRLCAYADTGIDALFLPFLGPQGRAIVEEVHAVTSVSVFAHGLPWDAQQDEAWLDRNNVRMKYVAGFPIYRMAAKAIHDGLLHLRGGGRPEDLADRMAPNDFVQNAPGSVTRDEVYSRISADFIPAPSVSHGIAHEHELVAGE
jgi:carboxyvinyl-carboxyphosphonate phosphorylmutase